MQLVRILKIHNHVNQHSLCELYMNEYILGIDESFNLVKIIEDIQLRDFTSLIINQFRWKKAFDTFEPNHENHPLMIRMEHF